MTSMPMPGTMPAPAENNGAGAPAEAGPDAGAVQNNAAPVAEQATVDSAAQAPAKQPAQAVPPAEQPTAPAGNAAAAPAPVENAQAEAPINSGAALNGAAAPAEPKAAMPKDDDWDLPAGMDGGAFVPIEAE
jgi:hypothetical protein